MPTPDPLLPFGEYKPDIVDYEGINSQVITNVVPRGDGYGPFPDLAVFTKNLPATCRGAFTAQNPDGTVRTFAGTTTKLYQLNNTDFTWTDVSRGAGTYTTLGTNKQWQFAQFGNFCFATQQNDVLQVFNLNGGTAFANNTGSPPQADFVAVVGQFLVLLGLLGLPFREAWSGLGDTTNWTAGVNQSDFQDFSDGGITQGVAGGEYGVIFQARVIRQMTYSPGSSYIFQFTRICEDQGLLFPYAIARASSKIMFISSQGFQLLVPGVLPIPIGKEKVDRSFFLDVDSSQPQLIIGTSDPNSTRVFFGYKSTNGPVSMMDTMLCYDYVLERFVPVHGMNGGLGIEYLFTATQSGVTLEGLDVISTQTITVTNAVNNGSGKVRLTVSTINLPSWPAPPDGAPVPTQLVTGALVDIWNVGGTTEANGQNVLITVVDSTHIDLPNVTFVHAFTSAGIISGPVDAMTVSLDSFSLSTLPSMAAFSNTHALGFFNGANLEARLETSEHGNHGQRLFCGQGVRPITDASTILISVSGRERLQDSRVYSAEQPLSPQGMCPCKLSTRYMRARARIPAGTSWSYVMGVEPEGARPNGKR